MNSSRRRARVRVGTAVAALSLVLAACSYTNPPDVLKVSDPGDGRSGQIAAQGADGAVKLRNFLVVSNGNGQPGTLVGGISNETAQPQTVTLTVVQTEQGGQQTPIGSTTVSLKPSEFLQFGNPAGTSGGATPTGTGVSPSASSSPAQSVGSSSTYTPTPAPSTSTGSIGPNVPAAGQVENYRISSVPQPAGALLQLVARTAGGGGTTIDVPILPPVGEYAYLAPTASASASPSPTGTPTPSGSPSPSVDTSGAATKSNTESPTPTP